MNEDKMREEFEADAKPYGFELTRYSTLCTTDEPWSDYVGLETGHRWGGWLAGCASKQKEIDDLIDANALAYKGSEQESLDRLRELEAKETLAQKEYNLELDKALKEVLSIRTGTHRIKGMR